MLFLGDTTCHKLFMCDAALDEREMAMQHVMLLCDAAFGKFF